MAAHWELHLSSSPDFTRRGFGRKVLALGGRFSKCRGYSSARFVTLPDTAEGCALADQLLATFHAVHRTVVISRGVIRAVHANPNCTDWGNMAWVEVQYVYPQNGEGIERARVLCEQAAKLAVSRGWAKGYTFAETSVGAGA